MSPFTERDRGRLKSAGSLRGFTCISVTYQFAVLGMSKLFDSI